MRSALVDACVAEGWAWNGTTEMLSKGVMFLRLQLVSGYLTLLGRTGAAEGDMPNVVRIGAMFSRADYPAYDVVFPAYYEIFVFESEVFMLINYSIDSYQWCSFGKSTVEGLPGTGMWCGASVAAIPVTNFPGASAPIHITSTGGGDSGNRGMNTAALFWADSGYAYPTARNCYVHSGLDSQGWWFDQYAGGVEASVKLSAPLVGLLPNNWNSEAVLLPLRAYKVRPSSKISLIADLANARLTRVDNYTPGEIIAIGSDRWKIYPWFRKNSGERDGGVNLNHTGTFGWAIRYEGP